MMKVAGIATAALLSVSPAHAMFDSKGECQTNCVRDAQQLLDFATIIEYHDFVCPGGVRAATGVMLHRGPAYVAQCRDGLRYLLQFYREAGERKVSVTPTEKRWPGQQ